MENKHAMLETIKEEPALIKEIYENRKEYTKDFVEFFKKEPIKKMYFSGHGASLNDGLMVRNFVEKILKVEVQITNPTTFNYREDFNVNGVYKPEEIVVFAPAQAGHTTGPIVTAKKAHELGIKVITLTHDPKSTLAENSDLIIDNHSLGEPAYVETRGHIADVLIIYLCCLEAALALGRISEDEYKEWCDAIAQLPERCQHHIDNTIAWYEKNKYLLTSSKVYVAVGFAENAIVAKDGCLKIGEATANYSISYELEEYMHGPMLSLHRDTLMFFIGPKAAETPRMKHLLNWCRNLCDRCILICNENDEDVDEISLTSDFLDKENLTVLEYIIPFQILAHLTAIDLGLSTMTSYHPGAGAQLKIRYEG